MNLGVFEQAPLTDFLTPDNEICYRSAFDLFCETMRVMQTERNRPHYTDKDLETMWSLTASTDKAVKANDLKLAKVAAQNYPIAYLLLRHCFVVHT